MANYDGYYMVNDAYIITSLVVKQTPPKKNKVSWDDYLKYMEK